MLLLSFTVVSYHLAPIAKTATHRSAPADTRSRSPVALIETLPDGFPALTDAVSSLPPGFMPDVPATPHHTPFSRFLFNAVIGYIAVDGVCTLGPLVMRKFSKTPEADAALRLAKRLAKVPTTKFGWLQADLRLPLPPLEELEVHPIGMHNRKRVYLCRHDHAGAFLNVERSIDFTEHYGEPVFICSHDAAAEFAGDALEPTETRAR